MKHLILSAVVSIGLTSTALAGPGQLDTTFGSGGKVTIDFGGTNAVARAVALQPDGKIVVVGQGRTSSNPASGDFVVVRLTTAGLLDPSFGTGGKVTTDFAGLEDAANAVALQPDGRILAGGYRSGNGFALARYLPNGQLDSTFGAGGKVVTPTAPSLYGYGPPFGCGTAQLFEITGISLQSDGRIVVVGGGYDGTIGDPFAYDIVLARYHADGTLDPSLLANSDGDCGGTNGIRIDNISSLGYRDYATSVLLSPDGKILVGGSTEYFKSGQSHEQDSFIIRYQSNGVPDATFGDASQCDDISYQTCQGVVTIDTHSVYGWLDNISALALQPDGKVTSVGQTIWSFYGGSTQWSTSFALTRVRPDGAIDDTFGYYPGVTPWLLPPDAPPDSVGYGGRGIALDASGRIVAVGGTSARSNPPSLAALRNFAVARLNGNGLADGVFNGTGFVETDFFGFEDAAFGVAIQADGRIVAVGFANTSDTTSKMAVARYEGGGTCTYAASLWYPYYQATAGSGYVNLATPEGCPWTVATTASWMHVTVASGAGPRPFTSVFTVDPNPGAARIGTVTVAGLALSVTQAGTTAAPPEDMVVDFGSGYGVWIQRGTTWNQLHASSPEAMTRADLDGNGSDDLVVDFGTLGVWSWMNRTAWVRLHALSPTAMVAGDLDGEGHDEIVFSFAGAGTWIWWNNASWSQLHAGNPTLMIAADLDDSGRDELCLDFPGAGIWIYANGTSWAQLHPSNATGILAADLDSNQRDDLVVQFPGYGLWRYSNNSTWSQLHPANTTRVAAGDLDANGVSDLVVDFGAVYGVWTLRNNTTWAPLHPRTTQTILMVDRDGDRRDEIIIDFGTPFGLWQYANAVWGQVHALSAKLLLEGRFH